MSTILGIIRHQQTAEYQPDSVCYAAAEAKFPSAFRGVAKASLPGFMLAGNFTSSPADAGSGYHVFLWGHIFNGPELCTRFGLRVSAPANAAAIVCALIQQKGPDHLRHVNGQFLIILYDIQRHKVTLINDHLAVQQIVYYQTKDVLIFSNEVKYLLTHPDCPKGVDWDAALRKPLAHTVLGGHKNYNTWFRGIKILPEATLLETDMGTGAVIKKQYWHPYGMPGNDSRTAAGIMDEYIALLYDAVKLRSSAEGTTYALLSGGLDSSAICALAAKHGHLSTYSIVSQTTLLEGTTEFCDRMAREAGFDNAQFVIPFRALSFNQQLWKQRIWRAESPVNHTDSLTKTMLHYAIKQYDAGVQNILSGTGSDQMNGGLAGYLAAAGDDMHQSWHNLHSEVIDSENRLLIARSDESLWHMRRFINRDFLSAASGITTQPNPWMIYVDGALHTQAFSLLWDEQRASQQHGHDTFYPFLDYRLAAFIAAVPQHLQMELFYDKQILRVPSAGFVPGYIVNKPKAPYKLPEYDFRAELFQYLTTGDDSLFSEAFGDVETPHPAIDKKYLYSRIQAMHQKPEIKEWLDIMQLLNLGILEQLHLKNETDLCYEAGIATPQKVNFTDRAAAIATLQKELEIISPQQLMDMPVMFGHNCSLLVDAKTGTCYLSKRNNLVYEIGDEYAAWKQFLLKINNVLTTRQILSELGLGYSVIEEFFNICLKEQILVTTHKNTGY